MAVTDTPLDLPTLQQKLERYCVAAGGGPPAPPARVVIVGPGGDWNEGFERARRAIDRGEAVRIVAAGATYSASWPDWCWSAPNLSMAEPGGYEGRTRMAASRPLASELRAWCDRVFDGVVPGLRGSDVFYGAAAGRLLQSTLDATAVAEGVAAAHPDAQIECVRWPGAALLTGPPRRRAIGMRAALPVAALAGFSASCGHVLMKYWGGGAARKQLRQRKLARPSDASAPRVWLGVIGDWERANKHLVATLPNDVIERDGSVGVLLVGVWGVGEAGGAREVWPGIGELRSAPPDEVWFEQAVMPDSISGLALGLCFALGRSALATTRAVRVGPPPGLGTAALLRTVAPMAKLLSTDVLRAVLAARAARSFVERFRAAGASVVFCAANMPELAAVERTLGTRGVPTSEYMHGLGNDAWHGTAESNASVRFVWTRSDAAALRPTGQATVSAGLPVPKLSATCARGWSRVLILTNYYHKDLVVAGARQRGAYQCELLDIPALLRNELPGWPLKFRWRPHPSEDRRLVAAHLNALEDVGMSTEPDLVADLEWADLVVASHSSTAVEAIYAGLPVFVHVRPELAGSDFVSYLDPLRAYRNAKEVAPLIARCLRDRRATPDAPLEEEDASKRRLAGPTGIPVPLRAAVLQWAEGARPTQATEGQP